MIRVDDIEDQSDLDINKQEAIEFELSVDEMATMYSLDADVEAAATFRRPGELFEVSITREIPPNVVAALKRVWEAGGWVVGAFEVVDDETGRPLREREGPPDEHVFRLVFARPHKLQRLPSKVVLQALEARKQAEEFSVPDEATIERISSGRTRTSTPLLIRMPTRSRPAQALEVLAKYREMASEHVAIEVIIDEDDQTMLNGPVLSRLHNLDCVVTVGKHKNKIEACNGGRVNDWDVLLLTSDDMVPRIRGFDQNILNTMEKHFPIGGGLLCYNDGYNKDHVRSNEPVTCTLPIMGRHLYEELGYVYFNGYRSIYCDSDLSFLTTSMNRMVFVDEIIIEHRHFANSKARFDELYEFNSRHDDHDKALFEARGARGFDVVRPVLSILICSIPSRRQMLDRLVDHLRWQMRSFPQQVEICVDLDTVITVGEKRQRLLEKATGRFVVFVDDDDTTSFDYVSRVLKACAEDKDCCSLVGVLTSNGNDPQRFEHSLKYDRWQTVNNSGAVLHERYPNHLNAIRRDLALEAGFAARNCGEDHEFSNRVRPLLKSEASTGENPLYYYFFVPANSVQSGR